MTAPPHPPHAGTRKANPRIANTYYLCTHEDNEIVLPDIKNIACQHGIFLENNVQGRKRYQKIFCAKFPMSTSTMRAT